MAGTTTKSSSTTTQSSAGGNDSTSREPLSAVMSTAHDAADIARQTAAQAAARLPDAVAATQVYARDTQKQLNGLDDQTLIAGTTFSLGLGIGLFLSGAHRLLVTAALVPAGALAMTLLGRERSASGKK
ncbi:MAG: hypothetical protein ABI744_01880 [Chloroflexota bacterium]